jgi:prepilin-type N-terminal cleavage/methylation domain-containing protein
MGGSRVFNGNRLGREGQSVSHDAVARTSRAARGGVTLLELIVVLALLGLILAIAAPSFILPSPPVQGPARAALVTARRQAVIRGEPVTISIDGIRVHVSPLGTCIPETGSRDGQSTWDAIGCAAPTSRVERQAR